MRVWAKPALLALGSIDGDIFLHNNKVSFGDLLSPVDLVDITEI